MAREDIDESIARIDKIKREDAEFWDDHDRELALSFGHRPKGQEQRATRAEVRERAVLLEETLQELRQRAELEHVRRASSALTGAEPPTRDLAIEADLEVDMIGLVQEIGRLRVDLEEDRQRARALTEVSAG